MNILQQILEGIVGGVPKAGAKIAKNKKAPSMKKAMQLQGLAQMQQPALPAAPAPQPWTSPIMGAAPIRPGMTPYSPGEGPRIPRL